MAEINFDVATLDVEMNPESSPLHLTTTTATTTTNTTQVRRSSRQAAKKSGSNATPSDVSSDSTQRTTQVRRSSRQAAKKSGSNATPSDVSSDSTQRTQLDQPEGSKKDPQAGPNSTSLDVEMEPMHHSIQINEPAPLPQPHKKNPRVPLNKPSSFYLSEEQNKDYMEICVPLQSAALRGDWHAAEGILKKHLKVLNASITHKEDTLLHIVSATKHVHFAKKLVNMMKVEDLKLQNNEGETALWLAIASTDKMVDVLLKRNKDLLKIRTKGSLPFLCALWSGHNDVVECIYSMTNIADEEWKDSDKKSILNSCIAAGLFDIALEIINHCKTKGTLMTIGTEVLRYLAYKPAAFDEKVRSFFRRLVLRRPGNFENSTGVKIVRCIWSETVKQNLQKHEDILKTIAGDSEEKEGLLFTAARLGNYKFIAELLKLYPEIAWERDHNNYTIFHVAVIHRHENVYNLLYELGLRKLGTLDKNKDNILHLAAKKPAQSRLNVVSGAALQMQRELLWFEEVKTRVNSTDRRKWNEEKKSPQALFSEQHADLMEKGEKWMKNTANHCMVVAALIATIMFAAAFTLPGGNNGDTGHPILLKKSAFVVFVVADAVSLCTSSASILMFLAILTSRYAEKDFLVSLPVKLMVGLVTLFLSIVTMMIAFSASFFLLYAESMKWIPVSIAALAGVPVVLFALLQSRLLFDVINSTFNSRHLFRPKNRMI